MVEYMSQQELLLKANLDTQIIMRQIILFCKLISQLKTIWIFIKKSHQGIISLFYYFFHVLFLIFTGILIFYMGNEGGGIAFPLKIMILVINFW